MINTVNEIPIKECKKILNKMQLNNIYKAYVGVIKGNYNIYLLPCQKASIKVYKKELQQKIKESDL